jgi:hypothetical protein
MGDLDRNDRVDILDLGLLRTRFALGGIATPHEGDLTGGGSIDRRDFALLALQFGSSRANRMLADRLTLLAVPASSPTPAAHAEPGASGLDGRLRLSARRSAVQVAAIDDLYSVGNQEVRAARRRTRSP